MPDEESLSVGQGIKEALSIGRQVGDALDVVSRITKELTTVSRIENQEITFDAQSGVVEYSAVLNIKRGIRRTMRHRLKFVSPELLRFTVKAFPLLTNERAAVQKIAEGFEVDLAELNADAEQFQVSVEYKVDTEDFLRGLVKRTHDKDGRVREDEEEYWMAAQLRHLKVLETQYGAIDLRDIDVKVDVAIQQEIKTAVPQRFVRELEVAGKWLREKHRDRKHQLSMEHLRMQSSDASVDDAEVLKEIQDLFFPSSFSRFIDVERDFRYSSAYRGSEFYEAIPFPTFPKTMSVMSRTDLSLNKPVADGVLKYKKGDFKKTLEEFFPQAMKRLERD